MLEMMKVTCHHPTVFAIQDIPVKEIKVNGKNQRHDLQLQWFFSGRAKYLGWRTVIRKQGGS